jgi:hypothetical protein
VCFMELNLRFTVCTGVHKNLAGDCTTACPQKLPSRLSGLQDSKELLGQYALFHDCHMSISMEEEKRNG